MNYTPILIVFAGLFLYIGFQHLLISFISRQRAVNIYFGLFALAIGGVEIYSVTAIKATNITLFVYSFKRIWFFLFLVQLFWVFFLAVYTRIIYRKFLYLFVCLSILAICLNQILPNGLMRGDIIGFKLRLSHFNEVEAYITTKFNKFSILEFVLIILVDVYSLVILFRYFRSTQQRYTIWLKISFIVLQVVQVNDFLVMTRLLDFFLMHLGCLFIIIIFTCLLLSNYFKSINSLEELDVNREIWKTKEEIVHMIVHDLKLPLNILMNLTDDLSKDEIIDRVRGSVKKIQYYMFDILDMLQSENIDFKIQKSEYSINDIMRDTFDNVSFFIRQKKITFIFESDNEYIVNVDRALIERVLTNMLYNSVKYTANEGLIKVVFEYLNENTLKICISDNGLGIEKDKLGLVFNKFATFNKKGDLISSSSGLGLTFCKKVVEEHGGSLEIESEFGEGTSISFDLKITRVNLLETGFKIIEKYNMINSENMTELEINYLSKYYDMLSNCNLYEVTRLRRVIKILENDNFINKEWLCQLNDSVDNFNENSFLRLVNLIKPRSC